ncbi:flagellar protein FliS [Clostridia bacterium]|nr:flagellar protein FliS [Clostridia bacterium]
MAALTNPYDNYKNTSVMSASKEELTLMLYEGALKFCNQAIIAMTKGDFMKASELVRRVCDIIFEFQLTLDRKYPITKNFDLLYDYIIDRITLGEVDKDIKKLEDARDTIRDFRDMWKEAMKIAKQEEKTKTAK